MQIRTKSLKYIESILFIFIWMVFFLSPFFVVNSTDTLDWKYIFNTWWRFIPFLVFSLINHYLLVPMLLYKHKYWYFPLALIMVIALTIALPVMHNFRIQYPNQKNRARTEEQFQPDQNTPPPPMLIPNNRERRLPQKKLLAQRQRPYQMPPWVNSMLVGFLILGFDIGLRTTFKWSKTEHEREILEKEKVKSELAFLRNQVSPHFFMNTLNNIHSLIDIDAEEAKESIIQLSKLMRHLLYDSEQELIPLSKEISFIQSYVDLMKLRFTEKVKVTFKVSENIGQTVVPPLLFTSLIENSFKFGVSYKQESFIHIELALVENELQLSIQNSKPEMKAKKGNEGSGIGLENTRKRLDLLYQSRYTMNVMDTDQTFTVQLKLPV